LPRAVRPSAASSITDRLAAFESQSRDESLEKTDECDVVVLGESRSDLAADLVDERSQVGLLVFAVRGESKQSGGGLDPAVGDQVAQG